MALPTINLAGGNLPPEILGQQQQLNRQQQLAQLLVQQGQQTPQSQIVSGRYVPPSIFQNLAGLANTYFGSRLAEKGDKQALELAKQLRQTYGDELEQFRKIKEGQEAIPEQVTEMAGPYGMSGAGQNVPMPTATIEGRAAIPANPQGAYDFASRAYNPLLQQIGAKKLIEGPESFTLTKGAVRYEKQPDGSIKQVAAGAADVPDSIQYAIAVGQLPANPATWNKQQADYARSLVESKTSAGASKYDFSNMLGKSVSDVAPILIASKTATGGAIQQADAANRIIQSLDTNKIFTGAGANQKLQAAQIGQMLGVTGGKTEEIVANTRTAIQGLAQLTLQGRKQMRGEGAITESEGALAQRAMSGDINLTAGELRILANAAKRSAKFTYDQHQSMMGALAKDSPNSVPYYQLEVNPSIFGTASSDVRTKADEIINKPNKP
jgi:hypothetical protein